MLCGLLAFFLGLEVHEEVLVEVFLYLAGCVGFVDCSVLDVVGLQFADELSLSGEMTKMISWSKRSEMIGATSAVFRSRY